MSCVLCFLMIITLPLTGFCSEVLLVPENYPNIQQAIDGASQGDRVSVAAGTYYETLDFLGKEIIVKSRQGAADTVIDGGQSGSVVSFINHEGPGSVLDGFSIVNGKSSNGPGIYCWLSSPVLSHNIIAQNIITFLGSGWIRCDYGSPTIIYNTIEDNTADPDALFSSAMHANSCDYVFIQGNDIKNNQGAAFSVELWLCNHIYMIDNRILENSGGLYTMKPQFLRKVKRKSCTRFH